MPLYIYNFGFVCTSMFMWSSIHCQVQNVKINVTWDFVTWMSRASVRSPSSILRSVCLLFLYSSGNNGHRDINMYLYLHFNIVLDYVFHVRGLFSLCYFRACKKTGKRRDFMYIYSPNSVSSV